MRCQFLVSDLILRTVIEENNPKKFGAGFLFQKGVEPFEEAEAILARRRI